MTMLTSITLVTTCLLVTRVAASPIETQDEDLEHRAGASEALDSLVAEFRDSSVYPLILNPLAVSQSHIYLILSES